MHSNIINNKTKEQWIKEIPSLLDVVKYDPVFWVNPELKDEDKEAYSRLELQWEDVKDAELRWTRFAPLLIRLFPETAKQNGIIESSIADINGIKAEILKHYGVEIAGELLLKCDNALPIAGSIKARGGIYEVLKYAEFLAMNSGQLKHEDNYEVLGDQSFKDFFAQYSLAVGSTGNLGLSIGIMGAALGFKVTVHMSADAKQWKKDLLRSKGVTVVEYLSDYSKAVEEGRRQAQQDPKCHFVDDENSKDLFLGYSVAAIRLKSQLEEQGTKVDKEHPLFVYLPCGVGGAPGGICFGLKLVFGAAVHCFFVEPTHSPCMLLGLATKENDRISVQDFGLDNLTEGDGLAVGRVSGFVGRVIENLLSGVYTIEDDELYKLLALLKDSTNIEIEPSAAASLMGPMALMSSEAGKQYIQDKGLEKHMGNATHISWATGGSFVPEEMKRAFYQKGKEML